MLSGGYFLEEEMEPPFDLMEAFNADDWPMTAPIKEKEKLKKWY
jgi:hypothetical protein